MLQLGNTPPPQSTTPGLNPVSIHQMTSTARAKKQTSDYSLLLVYRHRKDERLSQPGWLVTYRNKLPPPGVEPGHVTHPSTNWTRRRVTSLIRPTPLPLRHAVAVQCATSKHRQPYRHADPRRRRQHTDVAARVTNCATVTVFVTV